MKTSDTKKKIRITFILVGLVAAIILACTGSARAATWTQMADMPTARWSLSTSAMDGKIYAIGGIGGPKKVEEYDPATDTWTQKTDMPTGRVFLAASAVDGKIYVIGGASSWGGTMLATVEEYDPVTDEWTQKADMPTPRDALSASAVNGRIYAIGGGERRGPFSTVEEYNPTTDTWTRKADMQRAKAFLSTCVVNEKIYAIGGTIGYAKTAVATVDEYDPVTDKWTQKADMPAIRGFPSTSVVNEKIFVFGGNTWQGGPPLSTLFQYDPATDIWTTEEDMPTRLGGMGTNTVGWRIYVIGGTSTPYPYNPALSTVWEYDVGLGVPSPDFNGDGIIDNVDVSIMIDHWHTNNSLYDIAPEPFGDDIIDVQDLIALSEHLFEAVNDPTLVTHWALDESEGDIAFDSAGTNDASVIGEPLWLPAGGHVDGAIQLDGIDDVVVADSPLDPAKGPFSVFTWIRGGDVGQAIISQPSGSNWLSIHPQTGCLITELTNLGRSGGPLVSETTIIDGQWHRIGLVWDGRHRMLYVDGVTVADDTQNSLVSSVGGFYIGTGKDMASGTFFSGLIDDVRVYNRVVNP